ncbi:MAG TPA: PAS domain S-box protein [Candidatus Limnocylindrales bacterium]|nr:PAS domain S-box protein [Candidatus Limnocylindrales bacterium]
MKLGARHLPRVSSSLSLVPAPKVALKIERPERPAIPADAAARDLRALQAAALEAAANPIVISQRDGTIIWVNHAFEVLSGYTRAEALGQSTRLLKSGRLPASYYQTMWDTILSGQVWQGEMVNRRKDGSLYHEEMTITPVKNAAGEISHFIAIKLDITERKASEERICRLAQVVENSAEMIAIGDPEGRIVFANRALLRVTGYTEDELVGKAFTSLLSHNNPPHLDQEIRTQTLSGGGWSGECMHYRKEGREFPVSLSTSKIKDNQGAVIGTFGIAQDITERKRLEEQLAAAQKMEAVGQLAGGIAHDFNNLLGVMIGYSELLQESFPPDDLRVRKLQQIKAAGDRAASLTRQLLAFSRKQVIRPRVIDLNGLVNDVNKMLARLVREDIELLCELKPALGMIKADPTQIEQVIINLVVNARDAMPDRGKIIIETANTYLDESYCRSHPSVQPGRHIMLAISDTGTGMDEKTQEHIFEPFFTTKEQGKGTGLGLATVYGIVKQSGGSIWVYSQLGKGTTFKIYFPCVDEAVQPKEALGVSPALPRGNETILLAEDAEGMRSLISELLLRNGYTVLTAESSAELFMVTEQYNAPIDLLLTDVVMPGMNGRELADRLRAAHPALRIVYMSGYTSDTIVHHGVLREGIDFIEKPFTEASLMRKLREVLDRN